MYINLGEDSSCFCKYLKILFFPTILFESKLSLYPALSRSELRGIPICPDVLAFFSYRLVFPNSYLSFIEEREGSFRYALLLIPEMRKFPGDRLDVFLCSGVAGYLLSLLANFLLLLSKNLSFPGLLLLG